MLSKENEKLLVTYLEFATYLSVHSISLIQTPSGVAVPALLLVGLKYFKIALLVKVQTLKQNLQGTPSHELKQTLLQLKVAKALSNRIKQEIRQESIQKALEVDQTT